MGGARIVNFKLYSLIRYLQKPGGVTIDELIEELNVSRASGYRYLQKLQDMNLPLTSERRGRKEYYFFDMDNTDIAKNIFQNLNYIPDDFIFDKDEKMLIEFVFQNSESSNPSLKKEIEELHEKMQVLLSFAGHVANMSDENDGNITSKRRKAMRTIHSFNDMPKKAEDDKMDIISKLCDAVVLKRVCRVTYTSVNSDAPKTYNIMPLIVFSYMGGIYTIVETDDSDYTKKLAVERIEKLEITEETFKRKTTLDLQWTLSDPFGLIQVDQFEAEILIRKNSVGYVMSRTWPEKRVKFSEPNENGDVKLTIITSGEFELLRWLRYMGNEVKLLGPDWLLSKFKEELKKVSDEYNI